METIVINKKKNENNTLKFKYKYSSNEAIALYVGVNLILLLICKIVSIIPTVNHYFSSWYPVVIPFASIVIFMILFSTKLILENKSDFFKKFLIWADTITIFEMKRESYCLLPFKNSLGNYIESDTIAIQFLALQIILMVTGLLILKHKDQKQNNYIKKA